MMNTVIVIDDDLAAHDQAEQFKAANRSARTEFLFAKDPNEARNLLEPREDISLVLLDIVFDTIRHAARLEEIRRISKEIWPNGPEALAGNEHGLPLLCELRAAYPELPVVMLSSKTVPGVLLWCWRHGARYYLIKPTIPDQVSSVVGEFSRYVQKELLVGTSDPLRRVRERIRLAVDAGSNAAVMITGESGTGKELVARSLHQLGARRSGPFVAVNCAAIPADLIESELFGHRRGAFTGAISDRKGKLQDADGGVLFLDEIGELNIDLQSKLLRALDRGLRFSPVGSTEEISCDVQIVAATSRDLRADVSAGRFRMDLRYRLNVFPIDVPPLRERRADILTLAEHFLRRFVTTRYTGKRRVRGITVEAAHRLQAYAWPGNVRELENAIEHAVIHASGVEIELADLPDEVREEGLGIGTHIDRFTFPLDLRTVTGNVQWAAIRGAFNHVGGVARVGVIEQVSTLIGLDNPSDLQRTVLPRIISACPSLEGEIRRCFPERKRRRAGSDDQNGGDE
jgi:DNA-binding NtrC family response regulator